MRTIWKYVLKVTDEQLIEMPAGAETFDVQVQDGKPCLWAIVDPDATKIKRCIRTHGTGHPVPETTGDYIGSYQLQDGAIVLHVFETE